ncbi:hypothetical protein EX30DRAFT_231786 [Ascodesmis nigricans]|uniref:Uncharacterized protein n=1 Tax=Ascodesmis nigricans TaxID=341454 RepID=A0A4S2MIU7_9PEZI|nr:hypothetical protein EX30DRAFT_231786 [Ascodesmis nigricans]
MNQGPCITTEQTPLPLSLIPIPTSPAIIDIDITQQSGVTSAPHLPTQPNPARATFHRHQHRLLGSPPLSITTIPSSRYRYRSLARSLRPEQTPPHVEVAPGTHTHAPGDKDVGGGGREGRVYIAVVGGMRWWWERHHTPHTAHCTQNTLRNTPRKARQYGETAITSGEQT